MTSLHDGTISNLDVLDKFVYTMKKIKWMDWTLTSVTQTLSMSAWSFLFSSSRSVLFLSLFLFSSSTASWCSLWLWQRDRLLETYLNSTVHAVLWYGTVYYAVQGGSNSLVCGWNLSVWPFKWKLLSSTFMWYCVAQGGSNSLVCAWNPSVWPLKQKLMSITFMWYCLLCRWQRKVYIFIFLFIHHIFLLHTCPFLLHWPCQLMLTPEK